MIARLETVVGGRYDLAEYPALAVQRAAWSAERPLAGLRILDATPIFRNTVVKYLALLAGGAELTVMQAASLPADATVVAELRAAGLPVLTVAPTEEFDVVLDCFGCNATVPSHHGYVELTRSGGYRYENCTQPVFFADAGAIKEIETGLGTGDGLVRALTQLGLGDIAGKKVVVFGCGKVGRGIVLRLRRAGADLTVFDDPACCRMASMTVTDFRDRARVEAALQEAWGVVSATGVRAAHTGHFDMAKLAAGRAWIANMGVEDEFGEEMPSARVLNGKLPLNFILAEPTQMRYIETTMALHNAGALELLTGALKPGLNVPRRALESELLDWVRRNGLIGDEIAELGEL